MRVGAAGEAELISSVEPWARGSWEWKQERVKRLGKGRHHGENGVEMVLKVKQGQLLEGQNGFPQWAMDEELGGTCLRCPDETQTHWEASTV